MSIRMKTYLAPFRVLLACALAGGLGAGVAANGYGTAGTTPGVLVLAAYHGSDESAIAANWTAFFNPKTPVARRISLLQDGERFAAAIKSQASSSLAAQASAKVTKVTLISATQAKVTYTVLENRKPAVSNLTGVAVLQNGTWKVGTASFCNLLAMENGGKISTLPPACNTAS